MTKVEGKVLVQIGTNFKEPLVMRWAVSKDHAREWAVCLCLIPSTEKNLKINIDLL